MKNVLIPVDFGQVYVGQYLVDVFDWDSIRADPNQIPIKSQLDPNHTVNQPCGSVTQPGEEHS